MSPQSKITRTAIGRTTALLGVAVLVALGLAAIAIAGASKAQSGTPKTRAEVERALTGSWRLTAFPITDQNGDVVGSLFGDDPVAKVTYTSQGHMWGFVGARDRTANPAQQLWYTGTLVVRPRRHEVVHQVRWSSAPGIEGTNLVRRYRLRDDRLVLSFPVGDTMTAHGHFVRVR